MIFIPLALLAILALVPLGLTLRRQASARGQRESALAVHRAQLAELDRDVAEGSIQPAEHANAVLEVQRRLLAAADAPEEARAEARESGATAGRDKLIAALVVIPLAGIGLYLVGGHPEIPAAPLAARIAQADQQARDSEVLVATLRQRVAQLDPKSETARQGNVLLGHAEQSLGHFAAAAAAWRAALAARFDPDLAAAAAELQTQADGKVTPETASLFRAALAAAPANAPWRMMVERQLGEGGAAAP